MKNIKKSLSWVLIALSMVLTPGLQAKKAPKSLYNKEIPFAMPTDLPSAQSLGVVLNKLNPEFLMGASTSEHQCSKQCTADVCSWTRFAQEHNLAQPTDDEFNMDLWNNYPEYFAQAKEFGLNSLRFSIEWALVQPKGPESFDQKALDHYTDMFICAIKNGITPVICFHHYTDPCWFIDNDGFEKEENIDYFAAYCAKVYETCITKIYSSEILLEQYNSIHAPLWATFNSPTGYAFKGYKKLEGPPCNPDKSGLGITMRILAGMMEAHVRAYDAIKNTYDRLSKQDIQSFNFINSEFIQSPQVGFLKNIHQLHPSKKHKILYPLSVLGAKMGNHLQHNPFFEFFTQGTFTAHVPGMVWFTHTNKHAPETLDWIGINYYSNGYMKMFGTTPATDGSATDNPNYRVYPQGLWRAIAEVSDRLAEPLGIPMYVTENGIATQDGNRRNKFYQQYMYALTKAVQDGYDVRGYLTWTLAENYEWPKPGAPKRVYGLLGVDENDSKQLVMKDGSHWYHDFVNNVVTA